MASTSDFYRSFCKDELIIDIYYKIVIAKIRFQGLNEYLIARIALNGIDKKIEGYRRI